MGDAERADVVLSRVPESRTYIDAGRTATA